MGGRVLAVGHGDVWTEAAKALVVNMVMGGGVQYWRRRRRRRGAADEMAAGAVRG